MQKIPENFKKYLVLGIVIFAILLIPIFLKKNFLNAHKICKLIFQFLLKNGNEYATMRTIHFQLCDWNDILIV